MIDRATIDRIMDATDIVDVISEFVTLRKRGTSYTGLCPFHDDKTPSFSVSPSKGVYKCFACGEAGNAVNFIMKHEQKTYPEALRWLANRYHIEIHDRELTDEERRQATERDSLFLANEWAAKYFEDTLLNNPDGQAIGLQYFRQRGFRDDTIRKFRLGFCLASGHAMTDAAQREGFQKDVLLKSGLCYERSDGSLTDRFAGRVIFPWIGISGKVVGFGGRLLDSRTKGVNQKYVNSPDSDIYHKDRELYGIYQAKKAIAKEDRVYMVEGYTDVISMHQCGIENVVANSGTALSVHQIHILHRFTSNITLLYDGDAAGIHAALRGTDMLLSEGMNLKVLLLPDGDDPDSFARKHSADEFRKYIEEHQTDFIEFKTDLLLRGERDPLKRSEAINSIVRSISFVTNPILRDTYLHDCSVRMGINEATLINTLNNFIRSNREATASSSDNSQTTKPTTQNSQLKIQNSPSPLQQASKVEQMLVELIVRNGDTVIYNNVETEDGTTVNLNVAQYIAYNLGVDGLKFANPLNSRILDEAVNHAGDEQFCAEQFFLHHSDIEISRIATDLCMDKYQLLDEQKAARADEEKNADELRVEEENRIEALRQQTEHLLNDFRMDYLEQRLCDLKRDISLAVNDPERLQQLMEEYKTAHELRSQLARLLGNNIIA